MFDVAVIGAGAAGMMAASVAGQRGLRVVLIDHATKLAEKIRISGGGRCNFTNLGTSPTNFISANPNFCRSALSAYRPQDFLALLKDYRIPWHEKHKGQLFCDESAEDLIHMLRNECDKGQVAWRMPCTVQTVRAQTDHYVIETEQAGTLKAKQLVIATGGMAIPAIGATDFALKLARQFGLKVIEPRPALVPLNFDAQAWQALKVLSGVSLPVRIAAAHQGKRRVEFDEDLLFTHRGLSGPAILQISSYWESGQPIHLNLAPALELSTILLDAKQGGRQQVNTLLQECLPKRLVEQWGEAQLNQTWASVLSQRLADVPDKHLRDLAQSLQHWAITPTGTAGYKKAEVMRGGVDTRELSQKSFEARKQPGLYFIGEAVDVTGWLGGYNFQWAWASGWSVGHALSSQNK